MEARLRADVRVDVRDGMKTEVRVDLKAWEEYRKHKVEK